MARALSALGYPIREFVLRTPLKPGATLKSLARKLGANIHGFDSATLDADVLWLAVPDDVIEECAKRVAKGRTFRGRIALHSAGALSSDELSALRKAGAATGSLHPMMSFPSDKISPALRGVSFAVEGDAAAVRVAKQIATDVGGRVLSVDTRHKALYHAFGAMIAPLLVGHFEAAERMARNAGLDAKSARAAMKPIVEKVIAAFLTGGADKAFSGPYKRGDLKTIERHLKAIKGSAEETLYRALAEYTIENVRVANRKQLKRLLERKS